MCVRGGVCTRDGCIVTCINLALELSRVDGSLIFMNDGKDEVAFGLLEPLGTPALADLDFLDLSCNITLTLASLQDI